MNFIKINGLNGLYPEKIEGTNEWYYCKIPASSDFETYDLFDAEEDVKAGDVFGGMNCALIHFPDGEVHRPFELKENVFVNEPEYLDGLLYFLVVDFSERRINIISYNPNNKEKNTIADLSLDEVDNCCNLMLDVSPITLTRHTNHEVLYVIWPEKKKIKLRLREMMMFRDNDDLYCEEWYENPEYHERTIVRDWNTGRIKRIVEGRMERMPNGDIWVL